MSSLRKVVRVLLLTGLVVVASLLAFLALQRLSPSTVVVVDAKLPIYKNTGEDGAPRQFLRDATPGEELLVLRCVDLKHYLVPEVDLKEGQIGYIVEGRFHLRRKFVWGSFGC
jgi:hypothetical protein